MFLFMQVASAWIVDALGWSSRFFNKSLSGGFDGYAHDSKNSLGELKMHAKNDLGQCW
jgi:hypothetical protein